MVKSLGFTTDAIGGSRPSCQQPRQGLAATLRGRQMCRFERHFGGNLRKLLMDVEGDLGVMVDHKFLSCIAS